MSELTREQLIAAMGRMDDDYDRLLAAYEKLEARRERILRASGVALQEMEDMLTYVPPFFQDKWEYPRAIAVFRAALAEEGK